MKFAEIFAVVCPEDAPKLLKEVVQSLRAILDRGADCKEDVPASISKYLDLIVVAQPDDKRLITDPKQVKELPELAKRLDELLRLKDETAKLKSDPDRTAVHGFLQDDKLIEAKTEQPKPQPPKTSSCLSACFCCADPEAEQPTAEQQKAVEAEKQEKQRKQAIKVNWINALRELNAILLPLHPAALCKQREEELKSFRNKVNKILAKDSKSFIDSKATAYQQLKQEVKEVSDGRVPVALGPWLTLLQDTVLPDDAAATVSAAEATRMGADKALTILKTFSAYSVDSSEVQETAIASALLLRYQVKSDDYVTYYHRAVDAVANNEAHLFALRELNKLVLYFLGDALSVSIDKTFRDKETNDFCLANSKFLPHNQLTRAIQCLLNNPKLHEILSRQNKVNILLNTLLDVDCMMDSSHATAIQDGFADLREHKFEDLVKDLQKAFPAAVAKRARELIKQEYSKPNGDDQVAKALALKTLADELDRPSVADEKDGFAGIVIRAVNEANSDHPQLFSGKKTLNFFLTLLKAADILNGGQKVVGLRNAVLREKRGEPVSMAVAMSKQHGPAHSGVAKTPPVTAAISGGLPMVPVLTSY